MTPSEPRISKCSRCRYYTPKGRRGGSCEQLNVEVQSGWKGCSLARPLFESAWSPIDVAHIWPEPDVALSPVTILHEEVTRYPSR